MNLPQYAWIRISQVKPWTLILPSYSQRIHSSTLPITVGHYNQIQSTSVLYGNTEGAYPIRLKKTNKYVKIGPLVGILTTSQANTFKGNRKNFKDLIKMGIKTGILIYVFSVESINFQDKSVKAHLYLPSQKKWIIRTMPLPDVIYNRIAYRKDEEKPIVKKAIQFFSNERIPFFNPHFFNKSSLFKWMKESSELNHFLPETSLLTIKNLNYFISKYPMIYLKPIHGKAGVGFIKIEKLNSSYLLTYQTSKITYNKQFYSFNNLWNTVLNLIKNKGYIIQQGIKLKTYEGHPYDVRILVQKNGLGIWKVSGIGIRVAGKQSITTHVPQGGHIQSFDKVINDSFGKEFNRTWNLTISDLAIKIATHVESKTDHYLGEISIDMGIDQYDNIWFFEANAKPMEFDEPNIRETSLLRLMQYFRYLSKFLPEEVVS